MISRCMCLFMEVPYLFCNPGVSTNINWQAAVVLIPSKCQRVVCGFFEVMLSFCPTSLFKRVDLPTLGRPIMVT